MGFCLFKIASVEKAHDSALLLPKKPRKPNTQPITFTFWNIQATSTLLWEADVLHKFQLGLNFL